MSLEQTFRNTDSAFVELVELKPILFGGSPDDPSNKVWLTRRQHFKYVRLWNATLRDLRSTNQLEPSDGR